MAKTNRARLHHSRCTRTTIAHGNSASIYCTAIDQPRGAMSVKVSAKIQMYRLLELGDCFLVTFTAGASSSRLLIDCGSFRNDATAVNRLKAITTAINQALAGQPLDVVVGTHQHNDHVSGFVHCESAFKNMNVQQVWLSWLDDPADPKAQKIGADYNNLRLRLAAARDSLHGALKGK